MIYAVIYLIIGVIVLVEYNRWAIRYKTPKNLFSTLFSVVLWPLVCLFMVVTSVWGDKDQ